jgi:cell division inhibitor SepF
MSMFKKAMTYLGLGSDEDYYDDYDDELEPEPAAAPGRTGARKDGRLGYQGPEVESTGTVRPIAAGQRVRAERAPEGRDDSRDVEIPAVTIRPRGSTSVRPVPASAGKAKPHTVIPHSFNSAQEVADTFKEGQPVIMNLQDVESDLRRRLIDFASGLCYGLGGSMEKVANGVYLLTPANVEVSAEERQRLTGRELDG